MLNNQRPELLAPAGDMEKLQAALAYGADAVYMGGPAFGLRAMAKNFSIKEMEEAVSYAHSQRARAYVTVNIFAHQEDFQGLPDYLKAVEQAGADALIISDPGVFSLAREIVPNMELHISTQANVTNARAALFWHKQGAKRIILARELSLEEIRSVKEQLPDSLELEAFVHGAMCISYSGRCLLSNYMSGRDSNRGACAQPCRWEYALVEKSRPGEYQPVFEDDRGTYIYNSKDLCLIEYLPELIQAGVSSFKIEGRMKTPYYVAVTVKAYREAIDDYFKNPDKYQSRKAEYLEQLKKTSHRLFTTGFLLGKPDGGQQTYESSSYIRNWDFAGKVLEYNKDTKMALVEQRNKISAGDEVEIFTPKGPGFVETIKEMYNEEGEPIQSAPHAQQKVFIKMEAEVLPGDMLRKESGK